MTPPMPSASDYVAKIEACRNRDEAATVYAQALVSEHAPDFDWSTLNRAIMAKWSRSALVFIKERAWKAARHA